MEHHATQIMTNQDNSQHQSKQDSHQPIDPQRSQTMQPPAQSTKVLLFDKSLDKKTFYLETSAFLTGVNIVEKGPKKLDDQLPKAAEINYYHGKLNDEITVLGTKISEVIKDHENDFFVAFKNKMYAIMKEMRELKEKASSERHKAKQEARLINLEKERDWFRREALKLDKMCKDHKRILSKLKATLENIEEDRDFFQEQLFNAKKVNKALLMELEKYKSSLISTDEMQALKYTQPLAITEDDSQQYPQKNTTSKLKARIDQAIKQSADEMPDLPFNENEGNDQEQLRVGDDIDDLEDRYMNDFENKAQEYKFQNISKQQQSNFTSQQKGHSFKNDLKIMDSQSGTVPIEEYRKVVQENAELKDREQKYAETIRHLKNQIDSEKKNARSLRADKVNFMMQRNELEEFFLQCIEEVRKDIVKRKTLSNNYQHKKNLKRSTSTASMSKQGSQAYQEENQQNLAKLDSYTATDKRKVIELLMSNENVLLFLYEKLFPATNLSSQSTQSRQNTAGFSVGGAGPGMSAQGGFRLTTDSGIPIGIGNSGGSNQNRSQTSVAGSRLNVNRANLNSLQNYGTQNAIDPLTFTTNTLPQASIPGMSIQNNIQNLNLNINLSKGAYGSSQFLPKNFQGSFQSRGATAPLGQQRAKKGMQAQLNALGKSNKYAI